MPKVNILNFVKYAIGRSARVCKGHGKGHRVPCWQPGSGRVQLRWESASDLYIFSVSTFCNILPPCSLLGALVKELLLSLLTLITFANVRKLQGTNLAMLAREWLTVCPFPVSITSFTLPSHDEPGIRDFGKGLWHGATGVVMQPIKGAKEEGVLGFGKGIGRGTVFRLSGYHSRSFIDHRLFNASRCCRYSSQALGWHI